MTESILNSLEVISQEPLDSKLEVATLNEVVSLGQGNEKMFKYYENMLIKCLENNEKYIWCDVTKVPIGSILVSQTVKYPINHTAYGINYSNRSFALYRVVAQTITPGVGKTYKFVASKVNPATLPSNGLIDSIVESAEEVVVTIKEIKSEDLFINYNPTTGSLHLNRLPTSYKIRRIILDNLSNTGLVTRVDEGTIRVDTVSTALNYLTTPGITADINTTATFVGGVHNLTTEFSTFVERYNVSNIVVENGSTVNGGNAGEMIAPNITTDIRQMSLNINQGGNLILGDSSIRMSTNDRLAINGFGTLTVEGNEGGTVISNPISQAEGEESAIDIRDVRLLKQSASKFINTSSNINFNNVEALLANSEGTLITTTNSRKVDLIGSTVSTLNTSLGRGFSAKAAGSNPIVEVNGTSGLIILDNFKVVGTVSPLINIANPLATVEVDINNSDLSKAEGTIVEILGGGKEGNSNVNINNVKLGLMEVAEGFRDGAVTETNAIREGSVISTYAKYNNRAEAKAAGLKPMTLFVNMNDKESLESSWFIDIVI